MAPLQKEQKVQEELLATGRPRQKVSQLVWVRHSPKQAMQGRFDSWGIALAA